MVYHRIRSPQELAKIQKTVDAELAQVRANLAKIGARKPYTSARPICRNSASQRRAVEVEVVVKTRRPTVPEMKARQAQILADRKAAWRARVAAAQCLGYALRFDGPKENPFRIACTKGAQQVSIAVRPPTAEETLYDAYAMIAARVKAAVLLGFNVIRRRIGRRGMKRLAAYIFWHPLRKIRIVVPLPIAA